MTFHDLICSDENNNPVGVGEPLKEENARIAVLNYLQDAPMSSADPRHIFGYTFGLDKIKDFISAIDKHNNDELDENNKMVGIRIYHAKTVRTEVTPPMQNGVLYSDVVIVPVLPTGHDYYKKIRDKNDHGFEDGDIILGESRPCPNQCKLDFIEKETV